MATVLDFYNTTAQSIFTVRVFPIVYNLGDYCWYTRGMADILQPYQPKQRFIPKNTFHEDSIQKQVCQYVKLQYPFAIFRSDLDSGRNKASNFQRNRMVAMNSSRAWPDLFIYEPRFINGTQYAGLALELKKAGTTIILKTGPNKGHLTTNPHIREQVLLLKELKKRGYFATIACGFDEAVHTIDWYFGKRQMHNAELF